jgi:hypothetical protein
MKRVLAALLALSCSACVWNGTDAPQDKSHGYFFMNHLGHMTYVPQPPPPIKP